MMSDDTANGGVMKTKMVAQYTKQALLNVARNNYRPRSNS